jgi:ubiquitin C-terminal hydrolase
VVPEPFFNLTIPMSKENKPHHLLDCFDLYTKKETLQGENQILNDKTDTKEDAEKSISFWSLPHIMVVTLKRFNVSSVSIRKNQAFVDFDETLDLSKYVIGYNRDSYVYELFGICNHMGGVHGGHYTSYVKNANNNWYHFNDTNVNKVKDFNSMKTKAAYCFFYRKKK